MQSLSETLPDSQVNPLYFKLASRQMSVSHIVKSDAAFVSTLALLLNAFVIDSFIADLAFGLPIKSLALTTASINISSILFDRFCLLVSLLVHGKIFFTRANVMLRTNKALVIFS